MLQQQWDRRSPTYYGWRFDKRNENKPCDKSHNKIQLPGECACAQCARPDIEYARTSLRSSVSRRKIRKLQFPTHKHTHRLDTDYKRIASRRPCSCLLTANGISDILSRSGSESTAVALANTNWNWVIADKRTQTQTHIVYARMSILMGNVHWLIYVSQLMK